MSTSLLDADRGTHVKIVIVALIAAIAMSLLGMSAYRANLEVAFAEGQPGARVLAVSPLPEAPQLAQSASHSARDSI